MRPAFSVHLKNGNVSSVKLRLTLHGQKNLMDKYKDNVMSIVLDAVNDLDKMADVLTESLNYKYNENAVKDGEELYDLLVDSGYTGQNDFCRLMFGIAQNSGLITPENADKMVRMLGKKVDDVFNFDEHPDEHPEGHPGSPEEPDTAEERFPEGG